MKQTAIGIIAIVAIVLGAIALLYSAKSVDLAKDIESLRNDFDIRIGQLSALLLIPAFLKRMKVH